MTAPARFPAEYATFRRLVRVATVRLPKPAPLSPKVEEVVADCREAFALTASLRDGQRSEAIVVWGNRLERAVFAAMDAQVAA